MLVFRSNQVGLRLIKQSNNSYNFLSSKNIFISSRNFSWNPFKKEEIISTENVTDYSSHFIPEPPTAPDIVQPIFDLNCLGEPTFESLGLISWWWPPSWVQVLLETFHAPFSLPWWGAIGLLAVSVKLITMPFSIKSTRMKNEFGHITPKMKEIEKKIKLAQLAQNTSEMMVLGAEMKKLHSQMTISPTKMILYPMLQFPFFLFSMIGLRELAQLPVASMSTGGMFWFTDLTLNDPYYILPVLTMAAMSLQMEFGADVSTMATQGRIKWAMRAMPLVGTVVISNFPSALLIYWFASGWLSLGVHVVLRRPAVKRLLRIEKTEQQKMHQLQEMQDSLKKPANKAGGVKGFFADIKSQSKEEAKYKTMMNIEDMDSENWIKAGKGEIPKTYEYDPTKVSKSAIASKK